MICAMNMNIFCQSMIIGDVVIYKSMLPTFTVVSAHPYGGTVKGWETGNSRCHGFCQIVELVVYLLSAVTMLYPFARCPRAALKRSRRSVLCVKLVHSYSPPC